MTTVLCLCSALVATAAIGAAYVQPPPGAIITFTADTCDQEGWVRGGHECLRVEAARSERTFCSLRP